MYKKIVLFFILVTTSIVNAQKSYSLNECENQFLKNNLVLLAAHYNIDAAKALTIQSKIWDNPLFSADLNAYNPENGKYFNNGVDGAKAFGINQLIYLGGKKRNQIALSKNNEQQNELQFNDLLRNLKLQLRQSFYTVYFNSKNIETFNSQIARLTEMVDAYSIQVQKGNLPLKDLVRLQSLVLDLKNQRIELQNNTIEQQSNLKLLLSEDTTIVPVVSDADINKYTKPIVVDPKLLLTDAQTNRPDYLLQLKTIEANEINIKLQKSLALPDLNLGLSYTQRGGAFDNQKNVNLAIPLPLWNKNKGNIKLAETTLVQAKANKQSSDLQLQTEIELNYDKWNDARKNYNDLKPETKTNAELVYNGILENFQKRNISLLEFTDFMESYNLSLVQMNELKKKLALASEQLNSSVNKNLF